MAKIQQYNVKKPEAFIKKASFIVLPEEKETIISLNINEKTSEDIFSLAKPSRLVIDLEKTKLIKGETE